MVVREYHVAGIFARRNVGGHWFWWVVWGPPDHQLDRDDHWQPEDCFVDRVPDTVNEVWACFETLYPRRMGNVCLLATQTLAYHLHLSFPYDHFGLSREEPQYLARTQWLPWWPESSDSSDSE